MKHLIQLLLLSVLFFACTSSPNEYREFETDEPSLWNMEGDVIQTSDSITLTGTNAKAITTYSYDDFILEFDCYTHPEAIGGVYFHSNGYCGLKKGYEVLINNNREPEEWRKTGSLAAIRNFGKCMAEDGAWFPMRIQVSGMNIQVFVNDYCIVDYTQPQKPFRLPDYSQRLLSKGVFVFANHSDKPISFKNIKVKALEPGISHIAEAMDEQNDHLMRLQQMNFPLIDAHFYLKGELMEEDIVLLTRKQGITYGIASNCGINSDINSDKQAYKWLDKMRNQPFLLPMHAEGREWLSLFSKDLIDSFDYVIGDALSWTDAKGRLVKLWIEEETYIEDKQEFMDLLVERTVEIVTNEPIDLLANVSFLPRQLQAEYDQLWTKHRMEQIIDACVANKVAIEINNRHQIPSEAFIRLAKEKGATFSIGTSSAELEDIDRLTYAVEMIEACELSPQDMFVPTSKNR